MKPATIMIRVTPETKKLAESFRVGRETLGDVVLRGLLALRQEANKAKRKTQS